ncbi:Inheritance of peroxisomes protein 1 [Microdochium nivale]|nr:Inheritance of peroxisomes protein 1 [Microdochium nivale]
MTAPEHPGADAPFSPPRRSATTPLMPRRSSTSSVPAKSPLQDDVVETLYSHPSVKIVAFTTDQRVSVGSGSPSTADPRPGTLPPSSSTERTIAIGPFRIYKAPGSVAFLSCGSALQPILPKSQCWRMTEDNSRFVLQIRRPQYWRIELPIEDDDDEAQALLFRNILAETLQFEQTECPFKRNFTVALPERPSTPIRKRAWTAEGKYLVSTAFLDSPPPAVSPINLTGARQVTPNSRDRGEQRPFQWYESTRTRRPIEEDDDESQAIDPEDLHRFSIEHPSHVRKTVDGLEVTIAEYMKWKRASAQHKTMEGTKPWRRPNTSLEDDAGSPGGPNDDLFATDERGLETTPPRSAGKKKAVGEVGHNEEASAYEGSGYVAPVNLNKKRMSRMLAGRSYTAPPHLAVATTSTKQISTAKGKKTVSPTPLPKSRAKASGATSSVDPASSFRAVESWQPKDATLPPSPPMSHGGSPDRFPPPHENIVLKGLDIPLRDGSVSTVTPGAARYAPSSARGTSRSRSASPFPRSPIDLVDEPAEQESVSVLPTDNLSAGATDQGPQVRHRLRKSNLSVSRRALSPLPPPANLFTPRKSRQDRMVVMKRLPGFVFSKTFEMLLSPPSHLVQLILRVARKIIAGEWRGLVFGFNEDGEKIPVQWDYSDDDWDDDDDDCSFGRSSGRRQSIAHWDDDAATSRSCEVD